MMTKRKTPYRTCVDLFGTPAALAEVCGVDRSTVSYWGLPRKEDGGPRSGHGGAIPNRHFRKIIDAARARRLTLNRADLVL